MTGQFHHLYMHFRITQTQIKSMLGNTMEVNTMKALMGESVRIINIHKNSNRPTTEQVSVNNIQFTNTKAA